MAITAAKIIRKIEEFYPRSLAESWDNPGLLAGRGDREVHTVVIALDVSRRVVDLAVREHADLILSHHPLIFGSIKSVNDETFLGRKLLDLIENKISCYAMHTNFDIARNGMAYIAAEKLGLADFTPLEVTGEQDGEPVGIGFVGDVTPAMMQRAEHLKDMKNTGFVSVRGECSTGSGIPSGNASAAEAHHGPVYSVGSPDSARRQSDDRFPAAGQQADGSFLTARQLAALCKECFGLQSAFYYDGGRPIRRIAVCPGSGRHMMDAVLAKKADAFVTGDTGHHDGMDYFDEGITLVDAGHFGVEHIYVEHMKQFMEKQFPEVKLIKEVTDERQYV